MTDNIFETETAAITLRTHYSEDPGILLTDFSCAYPCVDQRWIFLVLELAGVPLVVRRFLRGIYNESITTVEHAGAPRGQLARIRGVTSRLLGKRLFVHHGRRPLLQVAHVSCLAA